MSLAYFDNHYASNSDLKRIVNKYIHGREEPENLEEIFDLGTLIHQILLEPHKANRSHPEYDLAVEMSKTIFKDPLCRQLILISDFKREHEFYRINCHGIKGRAKMDGSSKMISTVMEYKGLAVTTYNGFMEAIDRFDYDQGIAWYLDVSEYTHALVPAPSKKDPRILNKILVDRNHPIYHRGLQKVKYAVQVWKDFFPQEIQSYA